MKGECRYAARVLFLYPWRVLLNLNLNLLMILVNITLKLGLVSHSSHCCYFENLQPLPPSIICLQQMEISLFKEKVHAILLKIFEAQDSYADLNTIISDFKKY